MRSQTVFDSGDYETDDEAEAAFEAFFERIIEGRVYEKGPKFSAYRPVPSDYFHQPK